MLKNIKRKIKRKFRNMSTNKLVMFISVFLVCFITVGYASLNQILKLVGYASIDKGDGVIFTNIVTKENNGATIVTDGNIKAKTLVNTQVSFDKPGSITYTITAKNEAEYDAQLIEIKDLELTNNKEPKCITVSINGHEINDKIYTGATKEFDITITSTCNTLETKEISLKFNYVKTDTINGAIPNIGNKTEELLQNSEKTYNYLEGTYLKGKQRGNYVWFNGFMWRIMGKNADGSVRMITEENVTAIPWGANNTAEDYDNSYVNDWLNNYFYPKLKNKELLVKQTWCSETTTSNSSARTTCSNNLSKIQHYVGLLSLDEYNLASAGSSYLNIFQYLWTLTPYSPSYVWVVSSDGSVKYNSFSNYNGVRPVINILSEITITGGNGTLTDPYLFEDKSSSITGTLKDNSQVGEYVTYAGRNYRVVEKSESGTKLILDGYYDSNDDGTIDSSDKMSYGTNCSLCTTINEDNFINWLSNNDESERNKLASTIWYRGDYWTDDNYRTNLESTSNPYEGKVGLIRVGEMLSGQSETILSKNHSVINSYANARTYWAATQNKSSSVWGVNSDGGSGKFNISLANYLRPVINISSKIEIVGGNGTPNNPYELGDAPETFSQYLVKNKLNTDVSNSNAIGLYGIDNSGNLTTSSSPREYRYVGKTPNNYIKFNNELWQIIGIFDNKIKIIRTHSLGKYLVGDIRNFYEGQATFDYLNGEYYNSIVGKEKINKSTYYTYGMAFTGYTRNEIYNREMNYYSKEVQANIYYTAASDYAFSVSPSCMSMLDSYSSCASVNWMVNNEQFIIYGFSGGSRDSNGTIVQENGGTGTYSIFMSPTEVDIRPVLYLKEDVYYASGTGTSTDPYILE